MTVYVSNKEIEQIADGLLQVTVGKPPPKRIDIDAIAQFLKITVRYERIAEDDPDKIGFAADGVTPLHIIRNGIKKKVIFPRDTIILEHFLQNTDECTRRRFVLAHEISHILIGRADPTQSAACFNRVYDNERAYNVQELRDRLNLRECQANAMAALLLMPKETLSASVRHHIRKTAIPVYGECIFLPEVKPAMQKMADELGVSYTAMIIQLRKYGLLEPRGMEEYFRKTMTAGGDAN